MGAIAPILGIVSTVASTVVSATGAMAAAESEANMFKYQQEVANMNAQIAEDNAKRARDVAQVNQQDQDNQAAAFLGEQLAIQSASGVDLGSRSSLGSRKASRAVARRDALNVIQAGELNAYNSLTDKVNFDAQAAQAGMAADNALLKGRINMMTSLVGATKGFASQLGRFGGGGFAAAQPRVRMV
jgi:hypothetical protein